jgi:hydroxyethylthiazole kinase-like uncharacterized protein yjeF
VYGRRVVVVVGKGNNGNDGRVAARRLRERGVLVKVIDAASMPPRLPEAHLLVDAAYGTGFRGSWTPPRVDAPVLAVDIPSGVDGLTGEAEGDPWPANRTVTFAALKPGLLFSSGRVLAGQVTIVDIGLDVGASSASVLEQSDVRAWLPRPMPDAHKWRTALWVVAGSAGMRGAGYLTARAAQRAGAGMVRFGSPGVSEPTVPTEAVGRSLPAAGWASAVLSELSRVGVAVVGPGLGRSDSIASGVRELLRAPVPLVLDADALWALAADQTAAAQALSDRSFPTVLTPHDGEFAMLTGDPVGADRFDSARKLAAQLDVVVLLKGPTTVVAGPDGRVLATTAGDARLASAGTGDVLSGIIGAMVASGLPAFEAAATAAWIHGDAASRGRRRGFLAGDLPDLIPLTLEELSQ